jgi:hypothetical protein
MKKSLVFALRSRNVDALTAAEANMVLFTFNTRDYCALHQNWMQSEKIHSGIIVAPQQHYSVGEEMRRTMRLISHYTAEQMRNKIEFLSSWA